MVKKKSKIGAFVHKHIVKTKFDDLPENVRKSLKSIDGDQNLGHHQSKTSFNFRASHSQSNFRKKRFPD